MKTIPPLSERPCSERPCSEGQRARAARTREGGLLRAGLDALPALFAGLLILGGLVGCAEIEALFGDLQGPEPNAGAAGEPVETAAAAPEGDPSPNAEAVPTAALPVEEEPPPPADPVPLYEGGERLEEPVDAAQARAEGRFVLDLGEAWTPYIFTERSSEEEERVPHSYRPTYLALARGELPDNSQGDRAERDKYLELFGIMPSMGLLRRRFVEARDRECSQTLDLAPLAAFDGFLAYQNNGHARREAATFHFLERQVASMVERQHVESEAELDLSRLSDQDQRRVADYRRLAPENFALRAAQERLLCEGYFEGKGRWQRGAFDWATHEALAEFERRHRIYGWGFLGRETLEMLRRSSVEAERQAVIRVLTERAMHSLGVLEDGSAPGRDGQPPTYRTSEGAVLPVPNLEAQLRDKIVEAFGLQTPESTLAFLEGLGELPADGHLRVALSAPELPEYYSDNMNIRVVIDRGDVWYEFPYDEQGRERSQPVERRPMTTINVLYNGQSIPLARFGTTIGGWRSEEIDGQVWWKYKNSPIGPRVWERIVSAPVWLPPPSTPARDLMRRVGHGVGRDAFAINYHETGPSYASAYGLVAAYHSRYRQDDDGDLHIQGDEGIRSHGSVDYMSIMRRHSHGCHRLHNHIAVRLMSWVLAHRPHRRIGQSEIGFRREIQNEGYTYLMEIERGGYEFELETPVQVNVLRGRIRGSLEEPIEQPLPRFNAEAGHYVMPDGTYVTVSRRGVVTPLPPEQQAQDAGVAPLAGGAVEGTPAAAPTTAAGQVSGDASSAPGAAADREARVASSRDGSVRSAGATL